MAKKLSKDYNAETGEFWFEFEDGTKIEGNLSDFSESIVKRLALHGIMQKGGDSTASKETLKEFVEAVTAVVTQLKAGEWSQKREGTGGPRIGLLVEALARCAGRTTEECLAVVEALSDDDKKALRQDASIRKMIAQIRFERENEKAAKGEGQVDLQALMARGAAGAAAAEEEDDDA